MKTLAHMTVLFVLLVVIDALWLNLFMANFFKRQVPHLASESARLWPALLFYLLYSPALYLFVVERALGQNETLAKTFGLACFLGLVVYAAFDLTNMAIIKGWPLIFSLVDLAWGSLMSGLVATLALLIIRRAS